MSTAASNPPPGRYRGSRRGDSPAAPLMIVLSGALLVAAGAGIAVHNMATDDPAGPHRAFVQQTPRQGGVLPGRPSADGSTRASRDGPSRGPVPAVPPTVSPVPVPSPAPISYEAEAATVIRSDGVSIFPFETASGGQIVGNVRDGRTVRFAGVAAEGAGDYQMIVFYVARSPHAAQVRVNDGAPVPLAFPEAADNRVGSVSLRVPLLVGLNTIEFGGDCAALDRIEV
jgi:hypothetical protein